MRVFFSVGEPSGDLHGANLIAALRQRLPQCEFVGFGGPRMAAAGCRLHADLTELSVMWLTRVIAKLPRFLQLLRQADAYFRAERLDAVVLIDYPGFNWWVARRAKARGIPVVYYGTPQLWAWASHRVAKMRRFVDHVLCKLPFEQDWFRKRGCHATYVGHPYFDELRSRRLDPSFVDRQRGLPGALVTILPGSRRQEVEGNSHSFLLAARRIVAAVPGVRFAVAAFNEPQAEFVRQAAAALGVPVDVHVGRTPELIHAADCCLACSGSVSLELLYHAKPSVILYQISRTGYLIQRRFRRSRYITLVNLLTAKDVATKSPAHEYDPADPGDAHVLLPEYLSCTDKSEQLAGHVIEWLTDRTARERVAAGLEQLREQFGQGGASRRAADYLAAVLQGQVASGTATGDSVAA
jgi:lipid-A-disaccharide synthase